MTWQIFCINSRFKYESGLKNSLLGSCLRRGNQWLWHRHPFHAPGNRGKCSCPNHLTAHAVPEGWGCIASSVQHHLHRHQENWFLDMAFGQMLAHQPKWKLELCLALEGRRQILEKGANRDLYIYLVLYFRPNWIMNGYDMRMICAECCLEYFQACVGSKLRAAYEIVAVIKINSIKCTV